MGRSAAVRRGPDVAVTTRPNLDRSLAHLFARLRLVEARVRTAVARRRATDPDPSDSFRGLYLSEHVVDRLLDHASAIAPPDSAHHGALQAIERAADLAEAAGSELRLRRLARSFALEAVDVEILLIALAPEVDARFEHLYAYLHDDVTRRRASVGLALELCGVAPVSRWRSRFREASPLVGAGLLEVGEPDEAFLARPLRVPDRVAGHLLDDDTPDAEVDAVVATLAPPPIALEVPASIGRLPQLLERVGVAYVRDGGDGFGRVLVAAAMTAAGKRVVNVDLLRVPADADVARLSRTLAREARLTAATLVAGPLDALAERGPAAVRSLADVDAPRVLLGAGTWDPAWARVSPVTADVPMPGPVARGELWSAHLDGDAPDGFDAGVAMAPFRLGPDSVARAVGAARLRALHRGSRLDEHDLRAGARLQNAAGLERLATRIQPRVGWTDLVLPPETVRQLRELAGRARHRDLVLREWDMRLGGGRGTGVTALFAGESGTGKTMAAEVVAADLGLDLYAVDLATVVDKYIGETEKNLRRIFAEAEGTSAILFFDEADALFGKRSEVRDARDRYANVEVAYLLQRMETFDGVAVLATNLRANVDEAFARRLDLIIDFPMPDERRRRSIWERSLRRVPATGAIATGFLARAFDLSGGHIRNAALTAAYLAAEEQRGVEMRHLILGVEREYRKLGRLCLESEFGPYYELVASG